MRLGRLKIDTTEEYTFRQYLVMRALLAEVPVALVREAVSSVALEHPEWDMDGETRSYADWEASGR